MGMGRGLGGGRDLCGLGSGGLGGGGSLRLRVGGAWRI